MRLSRDLAVFPPDRSATGWRPLMAADQPVVAALLYDAYLGTIDDEGDTRDGALAEIDATMAGQYGPPISGACLVGVDDANRIVAMVITTMFEGEPLIAYVATDPACQRQGWATRLIEQAASALADQGERRMNLVVTVGNPAQYLYERLGFRGWDQRPPTTWKRWDDHG